MNNILTFKLCFNLFENLSKICDNRKKYNRNK